MLQIKYNQSPGNEPSGKQASKKKKGGRKLGRKGCVEDHTQAHIVFIIIIR